LPIEFIGLKEGEKVTEELWEPCERPRPTAHRRIFALSADTPAIGMLGHIQEFEQLLGRKDHEALLTRVHTLFPSFAAKHRPPERRPENEFHGSDLDQGVTGERSTVLSRYH
jgi:FlaA1/EpsC-like NDP-sugar epimerase